MGVATGKEESYGLSIKPRSSVTVRFDNCHITRKSDLALFSKTCHFPMATKAFGSCFLVASPSAGRGAGCDIHGRLVVEIADQIGVKYFLSPDASKYNFQAFMVRKINKHLTTLAQASEFPTALKSIILVVYQNLKKSIHTLSEGEILLGLPKQLIPFLDDTNVQAVWAWLIKENPDKEDREFFRKAYMLNRLFSANRKEERVFWKPQPGDSAARIRFI